MVFLFIISLDRSALDHSATATTKIQVMFAFFSIFFHNTQLEMHLLWRDLIKDTPLVKERKVASDREKRNKKSPAPGGNRTTDLQISWRVLYRWATTAALASDFVICYSGYSYSAVVKAL